MLSSKTAALRILGRFSQPCKLNLPADRPADEGIVIYCAGCNERFQQVPPAGVCPRCGAETEAGATDALGDTLLYKDASGDPSADTEISTAAAEPDELLGRCVHVYRCLSLLGRGGMGRVYLAEHADLHRQCALKILSPRTVAHDVDYVERFYNEGRAAAALVHPNVVTLHAVGSDEGYHYLEMEYVPGRSLQKLIHDEGRLTPVRATALVAGIAEGLAAAHRRGILHRDLKPDNVLLTARGVPKIADFGLAKRIYVADGSASEYLAGTPNFMAPELFAGEPASPSSDIYALGVCYFLLLTGRLPHVSGSLGGLQRAVAHDSPPSVRSLCPEIPLEIAECLSLLMAKTPANRPRDAVEAAQLIYAVLGQTRDLESLLSAAFADAGGVRWIRADSRYRLVVSLPDGRRQALFVEPSEHAAAERLLLIYSVCCKARPEYYEEALRLNSEIPHGGLAVRDIDGEPHFVMVETYPRATVDVEEIRRSVLEVAFRADSVEKLLTGLDRN